MNIPLFVFCKDTNTQKISAYGIHLFDTKSNFFNHIKLTFYNNFINAELIFNILKFVIIPLLLVLIFVLVIALITNRYKSEQLDSKQKEIDTTLNDFLTGLIFQDFDVEEIKNRIAAFKASIPYEEKWCRYLILNKLIHFKQNLHGFNQNRILLIYKYFGLQQYSQNLINDRRWYYKSLGIYHYQVLDYKIKKGSIKSFLKSKNKYLRSNALVAVIALSDEKFGVLDNYSEKISRADELKILDIIYHKQSQVPQNIVQWLQNKNNSIVLLALKLMIRYKVNLNLSQISYLLKHDDILVRKETLLAIRELGISDANTILIEYYKKENHKRNKISCLKTLGVIGNDTTLAFAKEILPLENDLEIKYEIVSCLYKLNHSFFDSYADSETSENKIVQAIVSHVKSPYLT